MAKVAGIFDGIPLLGQQSRDWSEQEQQEERRFPRRDHVTATDPDQEVSLGDEVDLAVAGSLPTGLGSLDSIRLSSILLTGVLFS